jgi:hypothetical protein
MVAGKVGGHGVKLDKLLGDRNYLEGYILRPSKEGGGQRSVRRGWERRRLYSPLCPSSPPSLFK